MSRKLAQAIGLAGLLVALSGCGFTPLYARGGVVSGLSQTRVVAPDGRAAYLLRERLDDALARNTGAPTLYQLDFTLVEQREPRGLGPDNAASRYELTLVIDYHLTEIASGNTVTSGRELVMVSYDAVDAPYAGIAAQQDSQERAAAEAASRIRLDLAKYFAERRP